MVSTLKPHSTCTTCAEARPAPRIDAWHPIVASNRGPREYTINAADELVSNRASGGVVSALAGLAHHLNFTWVASAVTEGDRRAALHTIDDSTANPRLRFVVLRPDVYHHHYNLFSNPLLWFLQHSLWSRLGHQAIDAGLTTGWTAGYLPANAAFATTIAGEARRLGGRPLIMLQDYHLYLAPEYLRHMLPDALIQHFIHIPWPAPEAWLVLPKEMRSAIFRSLLANDIVGFQTARDAHHFLEACATFVPDADIDYGHSSTMLRGHHAKVSVYPISIDTADLETKLDSPHVARYYQQLLALRGERTIVRVDRLDPSKDVPNGFRAFARLLDEHQEWRGRVKFLAFLVPSRTAIPEYRRYTEETLSLVDEINEKYGHVGYRPVEVFLQNNHPQAMAGLKMYDVLLVNPVADGMNLVAKEGPIANQRNGVLVLSEGAGAYEQLGSGALSVAPGDIRGMANALAEALSMPMEERRRRASLLRALVAQADLRAWMHNQIADLHDLADLGNRSAKGNSDDFSPDCHRRKA